jgi:hypothetical protein
VGEAASAASGFSADKPKADEASPERKPRPIKLSTSAFVSGLVADPAEPPRCVVVAGYVGASSEEGHVRLYGSLDLRGFVEIPKEAVLHQMEIPGDSFGGTYLWVAADAETKYKLNCG